MEQYIKKSDVVAEINRRINEYNTPVDRLGSNNIRLNECKNILSFLDTLEVKEVDLEKEFDKCCENYIFDDECEVYRAKHFFELGFKAQKGE